MGKKIRVGWRAAEKVHKREINVCQIPHGEEMNVMISVDHVSIYPKDRLEGVQITAKCCHCWKLKPKDLIKFANMQILKKTVENVQVRTKKLKNGGILVY